MGVYADWLLALAPPWLSRTWGGRLLAGLGAALDTVLDKAKLAVKARWPATCPDDALGFVGDGRHMERYRVESTASYRAAVVDARRQWETAGTAGDGTKGLVNKLNRLGYPNVVVLGWKDAVLLTPGPPPPWDDWWSAFFVVIHPNPFAKKFWGAPPAWGAVVPSVVGNPPAKATWGTNMNSLDVAELRRAIRKWKPAHERCGLIIFRASAGVDVFDPANLWIRG